MQEESIACRIFGIQGDPSLKWPGPRYARDLDFMQQFNVVSDVTSSILGFFADPFPVKMNMPLVIPTIFFE